MIFEKLRENIYIIIPICCIIIYAFLAILNFILKGQIAGQYDFMARLDVAEILVNDTENLYNAEEEYYGLPSHLIVLVPFLLFPRMVANLIFYGINIILAILCVREFNKILILMDVEEILYRFIFLMIMANGFFIYSQFWLNNVKFIVELILLFIIRREISYRKAGREKDLKFYVINYGLLVHALGIFPPFIYLLFLYLFQDIRFNQLFKKASIKMYGIIIGWFIVQNFVILIYPTIFFDLFFLFSRFNKGWVPAIPFFYLTEYEFIVFHEPLLLDTISIIIMVVITFFLIINKNLKIEEKFAYFCFLSFYLFTFGGRVLVILVPFTLLLFVKFLKGEENLIEFIKNNKILVLGLIAIIGLSFMVPYKAGIYKYLPYLSNFPFNILVESRFLFFLILLAISITLLHLKKDLKKDDMISNN